MQESDVGNSSGLTMMNELVQALRLMTKTVTELVLMPLVLSAIGYWVLDSLWWTLILALVGFVLSMVNLVRQVRDDSREDSKTKHSKTK